MKNENNTIIDTVLGGIAKITRMDVIVDVINSSLLGGGEVGGAIHRVVRKELLYECRLLDGCKTGWVKVTDTYNMNCRYIIHAMGFMWDGEICGG